MRSENGWECRPVDQVKFCFLSPLIDPAALTKLSKLPLLQLARNPWISALLAGGFAYFGEKLRRVPSRAICCPSLS